MNRTTPALRAFVRKALLCNSILFRRVHCTTQHGLHSGPQLFAVPRHLFCCSTCANRDAMLASSDSSPERGRRPWPVAQVGGLYLCQFAHSKYTLISEQDPTVWRVDHLQLTAFPNTLEASHERLRSTLLHVVARSTSFFEF